VAPAFTAAAVPGDFSLAALMVSMTGVMVAAVTIAR
jgi:hypothetical protein